MHITYKLPLHRVRPLKIAVLIKGSILFDLQQTKLINPASLLRCPPSPRFPPIVTLTLHHPTPQKHPRLDSADMGLVQLAGRRHYSLLHLAPSSPTNPTSSNNTTRVVRGRYSGQSRRGTQTAFEDGIISYCLETPSTMGDDECSTAVSK